MRRVHTSVHQVDPTILNRVLVGHLNEGMNEIMQLIAEEKESYRGRLIDKRAGKRALNPQ